MIGSKEYADAWGRGGGMADLDDIVHVLHLLVKERWREVARLSINAGGFKYMKRRMTSLNIPLTNQ